MSDPPVTEWFGQAQWRRWLTWAFLILVVYALRDFFFVCFVTFLLCYVTRTIVVTASRRLAPGQERVWLDRCLTLGTFAAMLVVVVGVISLVGPRLVDQSRTYLARAQVMDLQATLRSALDRTVGAYLMRRTYGATDDDRRQKAFQEYRDKRRGGEGWYGEFSSLNSELLAGFEATYEQDERARIARHADGAGNDQFDQWFLRVKAPELFARRRDAYLAEWQAKVAAANSAHQVSESKQDDAVEQQRDEQIRQRILQDVKTDSVALTELEKEWEQFVVAQGWLQFKESPEYETAFREYYRQRHEADAEAIPFSWETYERLREAYAQGKQAFMRVFQNSTSPRQGESDKRLRADFELATRQQLTDQWWNDDATAASIREHAREAIPRLVESLVGHLEKLISHLLTLPTQLMMALLLTLFITFDMASLKKSVNDLSKSRVAGVYNEVVPNLIVFARLIGRSFSAQGIIAVCNTLLTFLLLRVLGIQNELMLCILVFIASFIPVLGVALSGIPIAAEALLQPGGSLVLALQAVAGIGVIHLIETSLLSPRILGKVLHLHPVLVLVILVIGEHFFGVWGLLLGVPVAVYLIRVVILKEPIPGIYEPASRIGAG